MGHQCFFEKKKKAFHCLHLFAEWNVSVSFQPMPNVLGLSWATPCSSCHKQAFVLMFTPLHILECACLWTVPDLERTHTFFFLCPLVGFSWKWIMEKVHCVTAIRIFCSEEIHQDSTAKITCKYLQCMVVFHQPPICLAFVYRKKFLHISATKAFLF